MSRVLSPPPPPGEAGGRGLKVDHLVLTPYGWGRVTAVRPDGFVSVKLDWHAMAYLRHEDILERSRIPLGACALTTYGVGVLVRFRKSDRTHIIRLWNRYGCSGTALAYLRPECILKQLPSSPNLEVMTPQGPGTALRYDDITSSFLVRLQATEPQGPQPLVTIADKDIDCPRARVLPLMESIMNIVADLYHTQRAEWKNMPLQPSSFFTTHLDQQQPTEKGRAAITNVLTDIEGYLREQKASAWLESGRELLLDYISPDDRRSKDNNQMPPAEKGGATSPWTLPQVNFWDIPSMLGISSTFHLADGAQIEAAWNSLDVRNMLSEKWKLLSHLSEKEDALGDMIAEVHREIRKLQRLQSKFGETKAILALIEGQRQLEKRFESVASAPDWAFLRKRSIFFMNQFLSPQAASIRKAKKIVDAAQSRIEKHLVGGEGEGRASAIDAASPTTGGLASLGLSVLSDLQALLSRHLQALQGLTLSLETLIVKGFSEEAMSHMEYTLLVLFSLIEPRKVSAKATEPAEPVPAVAPRSGRSVSEELQKILADVNASDAIVQVVTRFSQGGFTLDEAAEMILHCLNTDDLVGIVKALIEKGHQLLARIESFQSSPGFRAVLVNMSDPVWEERFFKSLESLDTDSLIQEAENAFLDGSARQRLINQLTDSALDFLLDYLPSMPIPPITGLKEGVEYTFSDMDMSGFRLHKEDVEVTVREMVPGAGSNENHQAPGTPSKEDEVLVLYVRHISSEFKRIKWQYKQRYFPNMFGEGRADATVPDAQIRLGFRIKKKQVSPDGPFEPIILLSSRYVSLARINLKIDDCAMAWVYNLLASLFSETIRDYITKTVLDTIEDNIVDLLDALNDFARSSWPLLSRLTNMELSALPTLTEADEQEMALMAINRKVREDEAATEQSMLDLDKAEPLGKPGWLDVEVILRTHRKLGIHVDISEGDGLVKVAGVNPDGELARSLPRGIRLHRIIGATWVGFNGRSLAKMAPAKVIPLLRRLPRPVVLNLRLAPQADMADLRRDERAVSPAPATLPITTLLVKQGSAGIRFKPHGTLAPNLFVFNFSRGDKGEILPAESSNTVRVGQLLFTVNNVCVRDRPLNEVTTLLKTPERPLVLGFTENPDLDLDATPEILNEMKIGAFGEGLLVVVGFAGRKGILESEGKVQLDDVLVEVNGVQVPTPGGYNADMDLIRTATYPLRMVFERMRGEGLREVVEVVIKEKVGKLGAAFAKGEDGRPILKAWNRVPGPAEASKKIRPGHAIVRVGDDSVLDWQKHQGLSPEACIVRIQRSPEPLSLTFRDMSLFQLWKAWRPS